MSWKERYEVPQVGDNVMIMTPNTSCGLNCCKKYIGKIGIVIQIRGKKYEISHFPNTTRCCSIFRLEQLKLMPR